MRVKYVTPKKASELTGYSVQAIYDKKADGVWPEGVWVKAPDGRILINLEEYEKWVETGEVSRRLLKAPSKSPSPIKELNAKSGLSSCPRPLT